MQTLRKKTSPLKYRPTERFFGDGVVFKAKLIGILEVGEARGDRMCQEALQDLKVAIRAAGEHKQKITIHVLIEGLRLRDEKTGESLYHHPVHKISFIAQDMTDSRSFGYIFGSPDCGHRFFGIKTDKAASQVVLAMRDLFQCVFELKKKEIELAKQHIQNRITAHEHQQVIKNLGDKKSASSVMGEAKLQSKAEKSPEATANLVDLEQELSSIQRGITQMERITPNEDAPSIIKNPLEDDPFGDSFTSFSSSSAFSILPPPSSKRNQQPRQNEDAMTEFSSITKSTTPPIPPFPTASKSINDQSWLSSGTTSVFDAETLGNFNDNLATPNKSFEDSNNANLSASKTEITDAFSDLDPLGSGRSKPYVDKKYFFQDLKNPPKRILKDLSEQESIFDAHFSPQRRTTPAPDICTSGASVFDSMKIIDPFEEEDFSKINLDQFGPIKSVSPKSVVLPDTKISSFADEKAKQSDRKMSELESFNEPLHVDLPPESWAPDAKRQVSDGATKNLFSVDSFSKKMPKSNLFGQRNVKRESNGINMRRLEQSESENEPDLPPRPQTSLNEPPPLPPKNHRDSFIDAENRNRYSRANNSRYEYSGRLKNHSSESPPLPLPSRKVNRSDTNYSATSRPFKKSVEDDYLTPYQSQSNDIPTLLPPPQKKDSSKSRGSRKSETDPQNLDAPTPPVSAKPTTAAPKLPDITLSELLVLGIDDLATMIHVPPHVKLNTMTIVELTKYLSEFIEKSKQPAAALPAAAIDSPVFRVSFDDSSNATFVAKFDDVLEHQDNSFVANFENFNQPPVTVIPTEDRYAVFREIMDQETYEPQQSYHQESIESNNSNSLEDAPSSLFEFQREFESGFSPAKENPFKQSPQSLSKLTDAISSAKDRYAALRDIVLVEDMFDKSSVPLASISDSNLSDEIEELEPVFDSAVADNHSLDNVPTYSISQQQDEQKSLQITLPSNKDDFEIDDFMKKAISELSLDQRMSPNIQSKSPNVIPNGEMKQSSNSPTLLNKTLPELNEKDKLSENSEALDDDNQQENSAAESPKEDDNIRENTVTPSDTKAESWAVFEQDECKIKEKSTTPTNLPVPVKTASRESQIEKESPYSSDGRNDFKQRENEYHRRWPKPHTSSSSRDISPYEDGGDWRKSRAPQYEPPHYARPPIQRRRRNSGEEFDDEYDRRPRIRLPKAPLHRSKEILDENPNWHYPEQWSDEEDVERRGFDRNVYERNTYGPPYDKRDQRSYDRRGYDKRSKYYRPRADYEYDPYEMARVKPRKEFDDYEGNFERGTRESRSARDFFYERESRKSFDSNESYEEHMSGRSGHRLGSGDLSGSYDGREYRDRYNPHNRSFRRNQRPRAEDDSEEEVPRRNAGDTGSLQRPVAGQRSKHIQIDDDVWGVGPGGKYGKRPSSATAGERISISEGLSGSDGETDKRFRRKMKPPKGKEVELRSNYATIRYSQPPREDFESRTSMPFNNYEEDEPSPRNSSPRLHDPEAYYAKRKHGINTRTSTAPRSDSKSFGDYSEEFDPRKRGFKKSTSRDFYVEDSKADSFEDYELKRPMNSRRAAPYNSEEQSRQERDKFNFDGFESDFNSPPKQTDQPKDEQPQKFSFEAEFSPLTAKNGQQKLRFNENVSVSKFDANSSSQQMFEDDFLEWTPEAPNTGPNIQSSLKKISGSNLKSTNSAFGARHENIKKSDSVNIFARKTDDPFENDEFFNDEGKEQEQSNSRIDQEAFNCNKNI